MSSATFADRKGYVWVPAPSGHPKATLKSSVNGRLYGQGYVKRCWLVAESVIGRPLIPGKTGEHVHHINGIKDDDRPENLEVLPAVEHCRITQRETNPRKRIGAPSGIGPCAHCCKDSKHNRKRGLCNACYLVAKRAKNKTGEWPEWADMFPRAQYLEHDRKRKANYSSGLRAVQR